MAAEPGAWQVARAAELQEAGADLIAGHSAHVFHGVGWSAVGPVLTDLGDAMADYRVDPVLRNDLGVLAIWRPGEGADELELVGLKLDYCHTRVARAVDAEWIAGRLDRACSALGTEVERLDEARFSVKP
jgi:Bacterial capsule synthesis protein PGA_cap